VPHLQQGAKILDKKKLFKRVLVLPSIGQDVLAGESLKTATKRRAKQALSLPSLNCPQSGAGKKKYKKESTTKKKQFASRQEMKNISPARKTRRQIFLLEVKWVLFITNLSQECTKSELDLFTIPATQTSITKGQWIE